jgi:hypothetical protein
MFPGDVCIADLSMYKKASWKTDVGNEGIQLNVCAVESYFKIVLNNSFAPKKKRLELLAMFPRSA